MTIPFAIATRQAVLAAITSLVTPSLTSAQTWLAELPRQHVPEIQDTARATAGGDVDGDGDVDLVVGTGGQCRLLLGDGTGVFTDATANHLPLHAEWCSAVLLLDADQDGDLDLFLAHFMQNRLYHNDGTGHFTDVTATTLPSDSINDRNAKFADLDGDGDLDIVACLTGPPMAPRTLTILQNQGGLFVDVTPTSLPTLAAWIAADVALFDMEGDGDVDLLTVSSSCRLLRNDGSGAFVDASAQLVGLPPNACTAAATADFDQDGDLDVWIAAQGSDLQLRNDGTGLFTIAPVTTMPADIDVTYGVTAFDMDGDGDADLLRLNRGADRLYRNDNGVFVDVSAQLPRETSDASRSLAVDVDQDGDLDLVCLGEVDVSTRVARLLLNDGTGTFHDGTSRPLTLPFGLVVQGDVDGDGDIDVLANSRLFRNDGLGWFTEANPTTVPMAIGYYNDVDLADVDGDGDLDAIFAANSQSGICLNDGTGAFTNVTATHMPTMAVAIRAIAPTDVDGDGDLDLVAAADTGHHRLYRNQGGLFADVTAAQMPPAIANSSAEDVVSGDIDGDGDMDLVFAFSSWPTRVIFTNSGTGVYTDETLTRLLVTGGFAIIVKKLQLADLDGDLDLDLVACGNGQDRLFVNDGQGRFTDETSLRMPVENDDARHVQVGDIDDDGDPDLVIGSPNGARLLVNDGTGHFNDRTQPHFPNAGTGVWLGLADFDGDDDLDLLSSWGLHKNHVRQLHAPWLLRPGRTWQLSVFSRYGAPSGADVAFVWLSLTRTSQSLAPFGTLGIVPTAPLLPVSIPQPLGSATVGWQVPNVPSLAGVAVHAQALLLTSGGRDHLTNTVSDVLVR